MKTKVRVSKIDAIPSFGLDRLYPWATIELTPIYRKDDPLDSENPTVGTPLESKIVIVVGGHLLSRFPIGREMFVEFTEI
jgi:hypothetical protein